MEWSSAGRPSPFFITTFNFVNHETPILVALHTTALYPAAVFMCYL